VTHLDVSRDDVDKTIAVFKDFFKRLAAPDDDDNIRLAKRVAESYIEGRARAASAERYRRRSPAAGFNGKVSWQNETRLRFAIKNPKPGLIEKLCREVGLTVVAMKRIRIGRIAMSSLPVGEWRYLQDHERF
jgi:16S rRNA U516 pseudouridylate synthase RsuA-like enzyme